MTKKEKVDKPYFVAIKIEFVMNLEATDKKHAVELVKDIFEQEHNLELTDKEIVEVRLDD